MIKTQMTRIKEADLILTFLSMMWMMRDLKLRKSSRPDKYTNTHLILNRPIFKITATMPFKGSEKEGMGTTPVSPTFSIQSKIKWISYMSTSFTKWERETLLANTISITTHFTVCCTISNMRKAWNTNTRRLTYTIRFWLIKGKQVKMSGRMSKIVIR